MTDSNPTIGYPNDETQPIVYESITISPNGNENRIVEIRSLVVDIDIYEHLDKPYLTGTMAILDNIDLFGSLNINGVTKVEMKLRLNSTTEDVDTVHRVFYIDSILSSKKYQEKGELFMVHLIEDHAYKSNMISVNKAYAGTASRMITKLMKELDSERPTFSTEKDYETMKVIIPHLSPIDAMQWIKNRSVTAEGFPMYLFTTFSGKKTLNFFDLKTMLESDVINPDMPFTYSSANISLKSNKKENLLVKQRRVILNYEHKDVEDIYSLISKGLMVPTTIKNINSADSFGVLGPSKVDFDPKEAIEKLKMISNLKGVLHYQPDMYDEYLTEVNSRNLKSSTTQVVGSGAFTENDTFLNSYSQHSSSGSSGYKNQLMARTLDSMMKIDPLIVTVNGTDFLTGKYSSTIGNKIRMVFPRNIDDRNNDYQYDPKKTGDYLIYSARHSFRGDAYTVSMTGMKLSNGGLL